MVRGNLNDSQPQFPCAILPERAPLPDVPPHHLNRLVPGLIHDIPTLHLRFQWFAVIVFRFRERFPRVQTDQVFKFKVEANDIEFAALAPNMTDCREEV